MMYRSVNQSVLIIITFSILLKTIQAVPLHHHEPSTPLHNPNHELVDLTHPFDENTIYWINMRPFQFIKKIVSDKAEFFYAANDFEAGEHGGTHLDAPYHFNKKGWKVGDIPIQNLFVNGVRIDARNETAANPNYGLKVRKLQEWEKKNGNLTCPTVFLIDFGWAKKYSNKNEYFGSETLNETDMHFPGISHEAAQWFANKENVVGVGVDTPSVDTGENSVNPQTHITLAAVNKYMLENIAFDGVNLPEKSFALFITPMKIREGTGAPCRVTASVGRH